MKNVISLFCVAFCFQISFSQHKTIDASGDILLFAIPATTLGTTLIIKDKKGTWQFVKGFALNQALTLGLKSIVDKERPDMSNNNSFPSGHTSTTFQSAAFIQKRYGWKYGVPAYALASYTSFTRLNAKKHDFVDCLAGAIIGVSSSYLFSTPYEKEHMKLSLSKNEDSYLICYSYKF